MSTAEAKLPTRFFVAAHKNHTTCLAFAQDLISVDTRSKACKALDTTGMRMEGFLESKSVMVSTRNGGITISNLVLHLGAPESGTVRAAMASGKSVAFVLDHLGTSTLRSKAKDLGWM